MTTVDNAIHCSCPPQIYSCTSHIPSSTELLLLWVLK